MNAVNATEEYKIVSGKTIKIEKLSHGYDSFGYKRSFTALLLNNGGETKEG